MKTISFVLFCLSVFTSSLVNAAPVSDSFTLAKDFEPPILPGKWGDPTFGTGANITYSFMLGGEKCDIKPGTCSALSSFMPVGFKTEIEQAFKAWSDVANLTFREVVDGGEDFNAFSSPSNIRIGGESGFASGVLAHGFFPPNNGFTAAGDIHFNTAFTWGLNRETNNPNSDGFSIYKVMVHELGHALGLGHSDESGSIMAPNYIGGNAGLVLGQDDIAGIQAIYGVSLAAVPVPAAVWLFGPALIGFIGLRKKRHLLTA